MTPAPGRLLSGRYAAIALVALAWVAGPARASFGSDPSPGADPGLVVSGFRDRPFQSPGGIAVNPAWKEVLVANTGDHRIDVFSIDGKPLQSLVHLVRRPDGTTVEGMPRGIAVDARGRLFVTDNLASYVDVLDYRGRSLAQVDFPDEPGAGGPGAVAVDRDGRVLVATRGNRGRVHVLGSDLAWVAAWGDSGTAAGRLSRITGLAEAPDGSIVVTCASTNLAVQVFAADGTYRHGFGAHEIGPGNFSLPSSVAVTSDGRIWVSDELRQSIQVFDPQGALLGAFGGGGTAPGNLLYPSALASDGVAHLAVAERVGGRFQLMGIR